MVDLWRWEKLMGMGLVRVNHVVPPPKLIFSYNSTKYNKYMEHMSGPNG